MNLDGVDLVCSNCGSPAISRESVQRGIGGGILLGLCLTCSPQIPILPADADRSEKAAKRRRSIEVKTQVKPYRTRLTALVPAADYRPRSRPIAATSLSLFDD